MTKVRVLEVLHNSFTELRSPSLASQESGDKIKRLHKKRHFLSAYCKLLVYNIIPIRQGACVIKHYVRVS